MHIDPQLAVNLIPPPPIPPTMISPCLGVGEIFPFLWVKRLDQTTAVSYM